jgi:hypothetical protein
MRLRYVFLRWLLLFYARCGLRWERWAGELVEVEVEVGLAKVGLAMPAAAAVGEAAVVPAAGLVLVWTWTASGVGWKLSWLSRLR